MISVLGIDTSNYTTSAAIFGGDGGVRAQKPLKVRHGEIGLRQSEALFAHIRQLPDVIDELLGGNLDTAISAVGVSSKPRETEDSYMPCFLAGVSQAKVLSQVLNVPYFEFSHQQGHIAAAAWSAGRLDLLQTQHLAWHISGGTTELLYVKPQGTQFRCKIIGGTSDLSAGQLIDRTGKLMDLPFPAGKQLDIMAESGTVDACFAPRVEGLTFSLSGVQNKVEALFSKGVSRENAARYALLSIVTAVSAVTENARGRFGDIPVLFTGGVTASGLMRERICGIFPSPQYSTDNAMGTAVLTYLSLNAEERNDYK